MRVVASLTVLLTYACGASPQPAAVHSPSPSPAQSCTADGVNFDVTSADGYTRHAAVYGSGPVVVIAHQSDETRCDVVPIAHWLRDNHFAAVVVDLHGDWTGVLTATIAAMRARGATSVQLLGASMGGNVSMIVGGQVKPPVASIVSLGGERNLGPEYDADAAVAHSHVPLFIVTSENDGYLLAGEARALIAQAAATDKRSLIIPGSLHGVAMLDGPDGAQVKAAILGWLAAHAT